MADESRIRCRHGAKLHGFRGLFRLNGRFTLCGRTPTLCHLPPMAPVFKNCLPQLQAMAGVPREREAENSKDNSGCQHDCGLGVFGEK